MTPFLQHVTHAGPGLITGFLLAYGVAGILGNFLGGAALTRHPHAAFAAAACVLSAATLLLPVFGHGTSGALALLLLWGIAYGAVPVCSQTWFTRSAPHSPEAASVLFTASFQATIALGALAGGVVVDRTSPSAVMTLGGTAAALTAAAVWLHFARRPQWPAGS